MKRCARTASAARLSQTRRPNTRKVERRPRAWKARVKRTHRSIARSAHGTRESLIEQRGPRGTGAVVAWTGPRETTPATRAAGRTNPLRGAAAAGVVGPASWGDQPGPLRARVGGRRRGVPWDERRPPALWFGAFLTTWSTRPVFFAENKGRRRASAHPGPSGWRSLLIRLGLPYAATRAFHSWTGSTDHRGRPTRHRRASPPRRAAFRASEGGRLPGLGIHGGR